MNALEADKNDKNDKTAKDILAMIWETAILSSSFMLSNPATFRLFINRMAAVALEVADQLEELSPVIELAAPADGGKSEDAGDLSQFNVAD
jgi:molecular chaperone HtpG